MTKINIDDDKVKGLNFIIDSSALKSIFEGNENNKGKEMLDNFEKINKVVLEGNKTRMIALTSSFLRAIYLMDKTKSVENIQRVLEFIELVPNISNFKDSEKEVNDVIKFYLNDKQNEKNET